MDISRVSDRIGRRLAICFAAVLIAGCAGNDPQALVTSAKDYLNKNDYPAAIIQLKNALQAAPDNGEARLLLGRALLEQRDFVSAEKELRRALELGQPANAVLPVLAKAMIALGHFEKLTKEFGGQSLGSAEAQAVFATLIGDANRAQNKPREAEAAYGAALRAQPGYGPARLGTAMLAAMGGDRAAAMKIAEEVIAVAPKLAEAHTLKADLLYLEGKAAEARQALEAAVRADERFLPARKALAELLIREGAFDEAASQIAAAHKEAGNDLSLVFLEGQLEFEKGDLGKARDHVAQVLKYAPAHVPALVLAGAVELRAKQFVLGEAHLRKALAQAPGHVGARRLLIGGYLQNGQPARALEVLQPLIGTEALKSPQLMMLAGETFLANGDVKQAMGYFSSAAGAAALKGSVQTRLGQIALAQGDAAKGLKHLEEAAEEGGSVRADLSLIAAHLRRNELDRALAAARALQKKQPENPLSYFMLGTVNLARKDAASARKDFDKALQLQPTYLPAVQALAALDLDQNRPEEARKRFEAVIAHQPNNEQAYLGLAQTQERSGAKPEEMAVTLQRAIAADSQAINARVMLVNLHLNTRNAKAGLQVAQEAAAAAPNNPRVLSVLAAAQEATGNVGQAIETLNKMATQPEVAVAALRQLAGLHLRKQEYGQAAEALLRARRAEPGNRDVTGHLVQVYLRSGKFDEAMREVKALQKREPKYAGGYTLEGDVHAALKQWTEAEKAYREALRFDADDGTAAAKLHSALYATNKRNEADAFGRKWLVDKPNDASMRMYLANRAMTDGNTKTAVGMYQEVIAIEPNNALALNNLAYLAGQLGDVRALGYAQRAVQLAPNNAMFLDTLGMLLVKQGDVQRAFANLDKARALAPDAPDLRLNYAKALAKAGRKDEARRELEELKSRPDVFAGKNEIDGLLKAL